MDELRDHILQSFGVPASVLAGEGTYSGLPSLAEAYSARVAEEQDILSDAFGNAIQRFAYMEFILRPLARRQRSNRKCWWHCKKWQRRKSGRRKLVR